MAEAGAGVGASLEQEAEERLWEPRAPGRQALAGNAGKGLGVDVGLGNEVTAGRVEQLAGILSGPQISVQEGVSRG